MPTNLLTADTSFPTFTGNEKLPEKVDTITNYLYMLLKQLRYTLSNLGLNNFNETELKTLTDPIYAQLEDADGNIASLQLTAEGLSLRMENAESDITQLGVTSDGLAVRVSDAENNITQLGVTAAGLATRVSDAEGNISTLQQTSTSLSTRISNAEGNISTLTQTVNGFSLSVTNGSTTSTVQLMSGGVVISSQVISMNGLVTYTGLSGGTTVINGACIQTGLISADYLNLKGAIVWGDLSDSVQADIDDAYSMAYDAQSIANDLDNTVGGWTYEGTTYIDGAMLMTGTVMASSLQGGEVILLDNREREAGSLTLDGASSYDGRKVVLSSGAIEINSVYGDLYLESGDGVYLQLTDSFVVGAGDLIPNKTDYYSCGSSTHLWSDIYSSNGTIVTSDLNKKNSVVYDLSDYDGFFDGLKPMTFLFNDGTSGRKHMGFGAQDVEQNLVDNGLTSMDFAGFIKSQRTDDFGQVYEGEYDYALRYTEFIPILVDQVQKLKKRVAELEAAQ